MSHCILKFCAPYRFPFCLLFHASKSNLLSFTDSVSKVLSGEVAFNLSRNSYLPVNKDDNERNHGSTRALCSLSSILANIKFCFDQR